MSAVVDASHPPFVEATHQEIFTMTSDCPTHRAGAETASAAAPPRRHPSSPRRWRQCFALCAVSAATALVAGCGGGGSAPVAEAPLDPALVAQGQQIFRYDTFGDETQWTDKLGMDKVISAAVDPTTALSVGLKVDSQALPAAVVQGIQNGTVDLKSPDTTIALLKLNAVVGVQGQVQTINGKDVLTRVGITCALCHSTVDNSFAPGIGKRLDVGHVDHLPLRLVGRTARIVIIAALLKRGIVGIRLAYDFDDADRGWNRAGRMVEKS